MLMQIEAAIKVEAFFSIFFNSRSVKLLFDLSIKSRSVSHNASSLLAGHSSCDGVVEVCLVFMDNSSNRCDFQKKTTNPHFQPFIRDLTMCCSSRN